MEMCSLNPKYSIIFCIILRATLCYAELNDGHYDEEDDQYVLPIVLPIVAVVVIACIVACCWQGGKCPCSKENRDKNKLKKDEEKGLSDSKGGYAKPKSDSYGGGGGGRGGGGVKKSAERPPTVPSTNRNKSLPPIPDHSSPPPYTPPLRHHQRKQELPGNRPSHNRHSADSGKISTRSGRNSSSSRSNHASSKSNATSGYVTNEISSKSTSRRRERDSMGPRTHSTKRGNRGRTNEAYTAPDYRVQSQYPSHHNSNSHSHYPVDY